MFALLFNLSFGEIVAVGVVALLVFGRKLPEVAAQLAVQLQRARRSLLDLRRETGIDREIWEVRRRFEEAVPRDAESPAAALRQARTEAKQAVDEARKSATTNEPQADDTEGSPKVEPKDPPPDVS